MITQKELCDAWGMAKGTISNLVKAGMPLTSEADAKRWKLANQKKPSRVQPILKPSANSSEQSDPSDFAESLKSETTNGRLIRARRAELVAYSLVGRAYRDGNPVALRAAIQGWGEAKKRVSEAEVEHAQFEELTKATMRTSEVQEIYTKFLGRIRSLLDALPASLATRANPSDPECAKTAIQEGVDQIFVAIQKAEEAFE
jgi:phage terminase Nu1 subunit (DNA packaging protein)